MDVDRMLREEVSSRQLTEWMAYAAIEPFGPLAERYGHAMTTAMVANAARLRKEPLKPSDFMPGGGPKKEAPKQAWTTDVYGGLKAILGIK